jgi:trehalose 6-phosphate synthase/phosphatase
MEGNKVIEVKKAGINKGSAALRIMDRQDWNFILALGDDVTDEDLFASMPPGAYTIKVGSGPTKARYCIESVVDVRSLLEELSQVG